MKTYSAKPLEVIRKWYIIDAEGQILGRVATKIANILRGKNKPEYTPHIDTGDFVIVINAAKIQVTGKKETDKKYYHHTGYPGGLKVASFKELMEKDPTLALEKAIKGMLPHNTLGDEQFQKLKIYAGSEHPHAAQQPILLGSSELAFSTGRNVLPAKAKKERPAAKAEVKAQPKAEKVEAKVEETKTVEAEVKETAKPKATAKTTKAAPAKAKASASSKTVKKTTKKEAK